jgi:hypothetical protein
LPLAAAPANPQDDYDGGRNKMLKKLLAIIALIGALVAPMSAANARGMTTTCEGKISWHPLHAYTAITKNYGTPEVEDECIFVTKSKIGRQILKTCVMDSMCSVEADIENASDQYEITRVISINKIGTPALDKIAEQEKAAREAARWAAVRPYKEKVGTCVGKNLKGEITPSTVGEVMDGVCSKEADALRAQFLKQFSYSGHYLFMNIRYELAEPKGPEPGYYVNCVLVKQTSDGFLAVRKTPDVKGKLIAALHPGFPLAVSPSSQFMEDDEHVRYPNWTKWTYVSGWFSNGDAEPSHGWVYSKYLEHVPCYQSSTFDWWKKEDAPK